MKDETIAIRVEKKTKDKLMKLAEENKRDFPDFLRRILIEIADKKIKITL